MNYEIPRAQSHTHISYTFHPYRESAMATWWFSDGLIHDEIEYILLPRHFQYQQGQSKVIQVQA